MMTKLKRCPSRTMGKTSSLMKKKTACSWVKHFTKKLPMRQMWMTLCLVILNHVVAHAQVPPVPVPILEVIKQGVVKVIRAVDLKIQRLQNETIWLQHAQKVMENTLSKLKLEEI